MTNYMTQPPENDAPAPRRKAGKPEPGSREDRLADALRANLRRRKAAAKKPAAGTAADTAADTVAGEEGTAETAPEKPGNPS